jgi:acyl carrier protein
VNAQHIQDWLVEFVAALLAVDVDRIDVTMSLDQLGVDSATTLVLAADLGSWLGVELSPLELVDHPTVEALAAHTAAALPVNA